MSALTIHSLTISVDVGDKVYGNGTRRTLTAFAKVPEDHPGLSLDDDSISSDGIDLYFTTWQTLLQTRYATGEIDGKEYARQIAAFLLRIERVRELYRRIRSYGTEELEALLKKTEEKPNV